MNEPHRGNALSLLPCLPTGELFVKAYLKRLAERLSAQPGAQVTDKPVQRMDRQQYGNGSNAAFTDVQLQVGCADSRSYLVWMSVLERQSAALACALGHAAQERLECCQHARCVSIPPRLQFVKLHGGKCWVCSV